jgi:hypothetical protein
MSDVSFSCFSCGQTIQVLGGAKVLKNDTCSKCDADLHCCRNCRFFDPAVNNQCRETQADWVAMKDRRNYCDYFEASTHIVLAKKLGTQADDARKKFESLFKK